MIRKTSCLTLHCHKNLRGHHFKCTSDHTLHHPHGGYNCVAWAVGKTDAMWWPRRLGGFYWPQGLPREREFKETLSNFLRAFESEGFTSCEDGTFERGFEKIALYVTKSGHPRHAARLLPNGLWTSKFGFWHDIIHTDLEPLEDEHYGKASVFMKRPFVSLPWWNCGFVVRVIRLLFPVLCYFSGIYSRYCSRRCRACQQDVVEYHVR